MTSNDADDVVSTFMAVTGCTDEDMAVNVLAAADFSLENAVAIYEGQRPRPPGTTTTASLSSSSEMYPPSYGALNNRQQQRQQDRRTYENIDEDASPEVVAASPGAPYHEQRQQGRRDDPRVTRHSDDMFSNRERQQQVVPETLARTLLGGTDSRSGHLFTRHGEGGDFATTSEDDIFRVRTGPGSSAAALGAMLAPFGLLGSRVGAMTAESTVGQSTPPPSALEGLFQAPRYISTENEFSTVCATALSKQQWVLLNILRNGDFRSQCMNRDLWRDTLVSEIMPQMFTVCQE